MRRLRRCSTVRENNSDRVKNPHPGPSPRLASPEPWRRLGLTERGRPVFDILRAHQPVGSVSAVNSLPSPHPMGRESGCTAIELARPAQKTAISSLAPRVPSGERGSSMSHVTKPFPRRLLLSPALSSTLWKRGRRPPGFIAPSLIQSQCSLALSPIFASFLDTLAGFLRVRLGLEFPSACFSAGMCGLGSALESHPAQDQNPGSGRHFLSGAMTGCLRTCFP